MHSGGRWTGQYMVLDAETFAEILQGSNRCAYEHAVTEIYVPGSAGDDQETFGFPVADGDIIEATFAAFSSEDQILSGCRGDPKDISITIEEAFTSSECATTFFGEAYVYPGNENSTEIGNTEQGTI